MKFGDELAAEDWIFGSNVLGKDSLKIFLLYFFFADGHIEISLVIKYKLNKVEEYLKSRYN